jgi:uncharacterized protein
MRRLVIGFILIQAIIPIVAWGQKTVQLSIATGGVGGVYYPLGRGMAGILSRHIPYANATPEATTASVDNCLLINLGKADLALIMADSGWDAYQGKGDFRQKIPLRTLAVLYPNNMHIVTLENKGIEKVMDMRGKRVSTGAERSGTEVMAVRLLESYGLDPDRDMVRKKLGAAESAEALRKGQIDAYFWVGGLPTPSVTELGVSAGSRIRLLGHSDAVPKMREKYGPLYVRGTIPSKTYPGQEVDVPIAAVSNLLVCRHDLKENVAYDITAVLFAHKSELIKIHPDARFLSLENQVQESSPVPFHPGAIRYYREKGLTH